MAKNYYPELPEIPYQRTKVDMQKIIDYAINSLSIYMAPYVHSAYAIFRNESANGTKGVNNNYAGIQADNARWTKLPGEPVATCVKIDSGNQERRFLCFGLDGYKISFELLLIKCRDRDIRTPADYFKKWVGKKVWTGAEEKNFQSMIDQGKRLIK